MLAENKILFAKQGSGFVVSPVKKTETLAQVQTLVYPQISQVGESYLQNIHILNNSNVEGVAFTPGLPPIDIFPIGQWQKLSNLYWRNIKTSDLNYSISSGIDSLKEKIANYLLLTRKIKCNPVQVIIVAGSLQSLYLIGNVLIDKGDRVYLEKLTFPNVISIFKSLRAQVIPLETDNSGLIIKGIGESKSKTKLIHVTPSNQYPTGVKMSLQRRLELLEWANENNAMIIENDYEHEINNWKDHVDSIFSLDRHNRTIYLGTFNRILHPSIRLGYMIVPPYLLPVIKALQMHSHRFVPQSVQAVMTDFIGNNLIYKHLNKVIQEANDRRKLFFSQFNSHFNGMLQINETNNPSFHLVAELPKKVNDLAIVEAMEAKGIIVHPLSKCYVENPEKNGLIMGYSCVNRGFMAQAMGRMVTVYKSMI